MSSEDDMARAVYQALRASSPSACVEPIYVGSSLSVIDGKFDHRDVARKLRIELQKLGFELVLGTRESGLVSDQGVLHELKSRGCNINTWQQTLSGDGDER